MCTLSGIICWEDIDDATGRLPRSRWSMRVEHHFKARSKFVQVLIRCCNRSQAFDIEKHPIVAEDGGWVLTFEIHPLMCSFNVESKM